MEDRVETLRAQLLHPLEAAVKSLEEKLDAIVQGAHDDCPHVTEEGESLVHKTPTGEYSQYTTHAVCDLCGEDWYE